MNELATRFPVIDRHVWLNHAAISPWPLAVAQAMRAFVDDNADHGPLHYAQWLEIEGRLRQRAATLLGGQADDVALVKNTSEGLCLVAGGLPWSAGDRLVYCRDDFPSNMLPWQQLVPDSVEKNAVTVDGDDPEAALIAAIDDRTRLVAVSSVRYDSGLRLDLERISAACRRHGALFVVDAIQHLGALPLDVAGGIADFVVCGSHKWLLAPEGLALFWSSPEARARMRPVQVGWRMWPDMFNFARGDWTVPEPARRFEPGTLNMAGIHGLDAALGLLLEYDAGTRSSALLERSGRLIEGLAEIAGIELITPREPARRAGIVSFRGHGLEPHKLHRVLAENDIHAAIRGTALRLSPHFYTPLDQLDRTLEIIARHAGGN